MPSSTLTQVGQGIFRPKIFTTWKDYTLQQLWKDLTAGILVGIIAIPLSIAFGIASGVPPESGLITAVIAGFIISALGGSRVQIGGPTGAFVVILSEITQKYGVAGLTLSTMMAGAILVIMGLANIGPWIRLVPHSVVIGFTSGIAVSIFSSQIPDMLGLAINGGVPAKFIQKMHACYLHLCDTNILALGVALLTVLCIICAARLIPKIPGTFIALLITALLVYFFALPIQTIGDRFGDVSLTIPKPVIPEVSLNSLQTLLPSAISIALLGGIESLLCAVVADRMIGGKHRPNTELIAQGIANIVTPLFGGISATGALARTAANIRNGGRTPVAGMIHAATILVVALWLGYLIVRIPMAALAGIMIVVAYNMSEWRAFKALLQGSKREILVLLTTFLTTVFVDLIVAVLLGVVFSFILEGIYKASDRILKTHS